jgi:RNA polymerase sigma factor (sigma-70 family)
MDKPLVTITYKTADGRQICVEVPTPVKELLEQSDRQIRSQRRQDRRHLDFTVVTDEELESSLLPSYEDAADLLEKMDRYSRLYTAIDKLTETQKRRLCLYFFDSMNYSQIARSEGVNHRTVMDTIEQALKQLRKLCRE